MNYLIKSALPEIIVVLTALVVLALGLKRTKSPALCLAVALLGLAAAILWLLRPASAVDLFRGMLVVSPINSLFEVICLLLAMLTVAQASRDIPNFGEYLALILLATVGLLLLVDSEELLMIFIGLELTGLSLYVLTAFDKTSARSAEAGLKYFLFGSTASAFTLFGLSFIYGATGTTTLAEIAAKVTDSSISPLLAAGLVMATVGFAFKIAAAPFHLWAPDAYQGAPTSSAAFIASGSKVASFVVLAKFLFVGFEQVHGSAGWHGLVAGWSPVIAVLAAFSILIGNLAALVQSNLRRLMAYSAVAHAGYTLLGLVTGGREGLTATLFYTATYGFTLVGVFGVIALVRRETGGDNIENFAGLRARSPLLAGCMTIFMLSLAGLPPLAGFFGKFFLFSATIRAGVHSELLWLVIIALFGSLISLYYYLMVLKVIFAEPSPRSVQSLGVGGPSDQFRQRLAIALSALIVLGLGVLPNPLVARIAAALG